jgi:hypothetical protein
MNNNKDRVPADDVNSEKQNTLLQDNNNSGLKEELDITV